VTNVLHIAQASAREVAADAVVIGLFRGDGGPALADGAGDADAALGGGLAATLGLLGASGEPGEVTWTVSGGALAAPLIVAAGLGAAPDGGEPDAEALRRAAGAAVRSLAGKARRIALALPAATPGQAAAAALGALLGSYEFTRYKTGPAAPPPELTLLAGPGGDIAAGVRHAQVLADAMCLTRDLVNTSPADLYPETLAAAARAVARDSGLDIEVLDDKELREAGFGAITAVGQGSARGPRLVRLSYARPGAARTVVFAGKGITFDSGGLSLKPAKGMEAMKSDMGGAAAVLGALQAIAALQPEVNVIGYLAIAENMPGGGAQRPSDVITVYGGKTVEVLNTDAEGRLVLADALARSAEDEPDLVVDVATLTGAQIVALGDRISAVMGSDEETSAAVAAAALRAGEQAWAMPLPQELRKGLDSAVADLANVAGDRAGSMLVAGLFLREFAPDGVRWAHVDIAGPAFNEGDAYGYTPKGGTGAAVRMLVRIAEDTAAGQL
jgi:leucyl aminopeptidase